MDDLLLDLTSGDEERAEEAAWRLAEHGDAAIPALRSLLDAPQAETRWWAVRALAEIPGGLASPWSIEALKDPDVAVRQCAALGISRQPDDQAVPALVEAMSSDDALLARLAANALSSIGEAAVPALLDLLENAPQPVRLEAVRALAMIGDTRAIPALFNALDGDSALLEYWANEGLERMGVGMTFFKP
jgi:HEAT repeat protein